MVSVFITSKTRINSFVNYSAVRKESPYTPVPILRARPVAGLPPTLVSALMRTIRLPWLSVLTLVGALSLGACNGDKGRDANTETSTADSGDMDSNGSADINGYPDATSDSISGGKESLGGSTTSSQSRSDATMGGGTVDATVPASGGSTSGASGSSGSTTGGTTGSTTGGQ